jgi:hypothetical protein
MVSEEIGCLTGSNARKQENKTEREERMKSLKKMVLLTSLIGMMIASTVQAAVVEVNADITTSTTWTAGNTYRLKKQIFVVPGATLTIEAGTVIASLPADQGSLAVCRGAKIYANGTCTDPVIFTSTNDDFTTWRAACNEWGNLTIMGRGLICSYKYKGTAQSYQDGAGAPVVSNTATLDAIDKRRMEGLTAAFTGDPNVLYGGDNDNDDSGSLSYVSLRYGGKVIALADELNGLSLGGIGRETDIHHIEIMNNVDDGIEIWGGTVNLKNTSIWNVGDDSLDIDQGWRGKVQNVFIVQGYSVNAAQGSGVGDNCIEMDGAEDSDGQPVTTGVIYNATVIGQPASTGGDHGIALRDGCRAQIRNSIFMDLGELLLKNDNTDGDGGNGYGYNTTLSFNETWQSGYAEMWNTANSKTGGHANANGYTSAQLQAVYAAQTSGNLNEISDCVFFRNLYSTGAYSTYNTVSALSGANNINNVTATTQPIRKLDRGASVTLGSLVMIPVTYVDPRAANNALTSVAAAPADGFFTSEQYRGAFNADENWLIGWSAAYQYGMTDGGVHSVIDINGDCSVDLGDFANLSENWMVNL